jgi:L-alanine-DL-glutamate epimerase-like enolase superfamily enzyme
MPLKLSFQKKSLPFQFPFTISKGTKTHQEILLVSIKHFGWEGFGEAPAISYYNTTVDEMANVLEKKKKVLESFAFSDPERFWHFLHHLFPQHPFLVAALDMAGWDLFGKIKNQPLHRIWNLNMDDAPLTDYTIGIDTPERMLDKLRDNPWPIYKVKVGFDGDLDLIKLLRSHTDARIRVDANEGWNLEQAVYAVEELHRLNVELIEQPLPRDQVDAMKHLCSVSKIPLIADESCVKEKDPESCIHQFHGINIKLSKCSGITPARRMISDARSKGLKIMLGSMNDSTFGSAAMAHLSPLVDYVDNDGILLQTEQTGSGLLIEQGKMKLMGAPGLGISPIGFLPDANPQ